MTKTVIKPLIIPLILVMLIAAACSKKSDSSSLVGSWGKERQTDLFTDSAQSLIPKASDTTFAVTPTILNLNAAKRYQVTNYVNGTAKTADSGSYNYANGIINFVSDIDGSTTSLSYTLSSNTLKTTSYYYEPGYSDQIIMTYGRRQ